MDESNNQPSWQMTPPQGKPLYTFDTHDTEKLYTKRFFLLNRTRLLLLVLDLVIILTWFAHILNLGRFTLLFSLFVLLVSYFLVRSRAKTSYKRQQRIQNGLTHYTFYEDCLTVQKSFGQFTFHYEDLYQIRIRKNSICLIAALPYNFALLPGEYPAELADFLRERAPKSWGRIIKDTLHTLLLTILAVIALFCFLLLLMVLCDFEANPSLDLPTPPVESYTEEAPIYTVEPIPTVEPTPTEAPSETATPEESTSIFGSGYIGSGYEAIYNTYIQDASNTVEYRMNAKGDGYYIVNDTDEAVDILQYDRDSENGSCGLYVYKRCPKGTYGGWSPNNMQILNIYAYHYWDGVTAASGKTSWGDASALDYRELTGE